LPGLLCSDLFLCMDTKISLITEKDLSDVSKLVNSAYRGEDAKKGWTHEAELIEGSLRTDENSLRAEIQKPGAVILKYTEEDKIVGCVYLEKQNNKLYLGMLSVNPTLQARGIGKQLLKAAEEYAVTANCNLIEMTVISLRRELIDWYMRNGYELTDEKRPFHTEERFGTPRQPVEFVIMRKRLINPAY
jgi:GNAT superfamily N-acetyltransferase